MTGAGAPISSAGRLDPGATPKSKTSRDSRNSSSPTGNAVNGGGRDDGVRRSFRILGLDEGPLELVDLRLARTRGPPQASSQSRSLPARPRLGRTRPPSPRRPRRKGDPRLGRPRSGAVRPPPAPQRTAPPDHRPESRGRRPPSLPVPGRSRSLQSWLLPEQRQQLVVQGGNAKVREGRGGGGGGGYLVRPAGRHSIGKARIKPRLDRTRPAGKLILRRRRRAQTRDDTDQDQSQDHRSISKEIWEARLGVIHPRGGSIHWQVGPNHPCC